MRNNLFLYHGLPAKGAWLWISTLLLVLFRQLNQLRSDSYPSYHSDEIVLLSIVNPNFSAADLDGDYDFLNSASNPEEIEIGGDDDEEEYEDEYEEVQVEEELVDNPLSKLQSRRTYIRTKFRKKKGKLNLTCSMPVNNNGYDRPLPFNVDQYDNNGLSLTCSMGCANVTIPINVPSFIIIGAQKGGTTALSKYFQNITHVMSSATFEPHFFDGNGISKALSKTTYSNKRLCHLRSEYLERNFDLIEYYRMAAEIHPSTLFTFEKSPSYIRVPGTAFRLHLTYPNIKLIAVLRDPVARSYSQYAMDFERGSKSTGKSFDQYIQWAGESLRSVNVSVAPTLTEYLEAGGRDHVDRRNFSLPSQSFRRSMRIVSKTRNFHPTKKRRSMHGNTLYAGMYALHLSEWLRYFELGKSLMVVQYEKLMDDKSGVFAEICDFLGIPKVDLHETHFSTDYSPIKKRNRTGMAPDPLQEHTREYLQELYRPYNKELARQLGDEWLHAWDY